MRKRLAELLAALTILIVVGLAVLFSWLQNPATTSRSTPAASGAPPAVGTAPPERLAAGRAAYERNHCADCHAIDGQGSPRSPLDGIGDRREPGEIVDWIVASDRVRSQMSARTVRIKQSFAELPDEELHAMASYLASLRTPPAPDEST